MNSSKTIVPSRKFFNRKYNDALKYMAKNAESNYGIYEMARLLDDPIFLDIVQSSEKNIGSLRNVYDTKTINNAISISSECAFHFLIDGVLHPDTKEGKIFSKSLDALLTFSATYDSDLMSLTNSIIQKMEDYRRA